MPKMMMMMMILMLASATMSDQRLCERPENPLTFTYTCISQEVDLCVKGRHLKVAQSDCIGDVDEYQICVPCEVGTFMDVNNYCDTCKPWKVCGGGLMEDPESPPTASKDRRCVPRPSETVTPSRCPPCATVTTLPTCPTCPTCPDLPTTDAPSTLEPLQDKWTSFFPGTDATPPSISPTPGFSPRQRQELEYERDKWRVIAIVSMGLFFIALCLWGCDHHVRFKCLPCCQCQRHKGGLVEYTANGQAVHVLPDGSTCSQNDLPQNDMEEQPGPNFIVCDDGQRDNSQECKVPLMKAIASSSGLVVGLPQEQSGAQSSKEASLNPVENLMCQTQGDSSLSRGKSPPPADESNSQGEASPVRNPNKPGVLDSQRVDSHGIDTLHREPSRREKDPNVTENTPSAQLPSASQYSSLKDNDSVLPSASHDYVELRLKGGGIHDMPTAEYQPSVQQSLYCGKSMVAYGKAEGPCSVVTDCTEWHMDFVQDEINIDKHMDFFAKLGVRSKHITDTKYNQRNEGIREQIRAVLNHDFIGRSEDVSISKLLTALDASGNKDVTRKFWKKFKVNRGIGKAEPGQIVGTGTGPVSVTD